MQKALISAFVLLSAGTLPALALTGTGTASQAKPQPVASAADARIDTAIDAAKTKVLAHDLAPAAHTELVTALRGGFGALTTYTPTTEMTVTRLVAAVDDIYARAAKGPVAAEEFEILRIEVLDARLAAAIATAKAAPKPETVKPIVDPLAKLADAAKALDPEMAAVRTRAQVIIDALVKKGSFTAAELEPLMLEASVGGTTRSAAILEHRALAKTVTAIDFTRLRDHLSDSMSLLAKSDASAMDLKKKLLASVDALEKKSAAAPLAAADFTDLKTQLSVGVRAASSKKK